MKISRFSALWAIVLIHVGLAALSLTGKGVFISSPRQAPVIVLSYIFGFLGYFVFRIGVSVLAKGLRVVEATRAELLKLGLPFLFSILAGAVLLPQIIWTWSDSLSLGGIGAPFLGTSQQADELAVLLVSLFLTFSSVSAWTSIDADIIAVNAASHHPYEAVKALNGGRETVISQFVERASRLERRSTYILVGIILMLVCAAIFIVFAGQITSLDVSGVKSVSLAQSDVRAAEDELDRISTEIARKQAARRRAAKEAKEQATKEQALSKDLPKVDASEDTFSPEGISDDDISKLKFEAKKDALKKANEVLLKVKDKQFEDDRPKDQTSGQLLLIQTSVTRFGVVLILVFLVQILVSLYRYNMKLSAFYFGRADALVLFGRLPNTLRALVDIISPDKLDFGKPPRTPAEEAGGLLHAWAGYASGKRNPRSQDEADPKKRK
jgi:hypothetical protein